MGLRTILYDWHVAAGARMVEFGGWDMPVQYDGVLAEHTRVRSTVGLFDTSHMNAILVSGPQSLDQFSRVVTQNLRTLAPGACRYGFILNEEAGVLDDLIVYRMDEMAWMAVVNAGTAPADLAWIEQKCAGEGCEVRDLRAEQAKMDVQGPLTMQTLKDTFEVDLSELKRFRWQAVTLLGQRCVVSRTGYTGEDGVEIYAAPATIMELWQALAARGVKPCGLGARDTLRLESGYPLYGHELSLAVSPAEANLMRYCSKDEGFIGREALLQRVAAPQEQLVSLVLEGRQSARHGHIVKSEDGMETGRVTSGSFAPTLGKSIGFAYVKPADALPGMRLWIDNGRTLLPATVVEQPFLSR